MRVLAINCGSSTLKFQLFELERHSKSYGQDMPEIREWTWKWADE